MPFKSEAQRRFMFANHPDVAKQWELHTPPGKLPKKLPTKVKEAYDEGARLACARFGIKESAEEIRLKIPKRQFHGIDAAFKTRKKANQEPLEPQATPDQPAELLAKMLQDLPLPDTINNADAKLTGLDRHVSWSSPMDVSKGAV